jgi:hypothetical protein
MNNLNPRDCARMRVRGYVALPRAVLSFELAPGMI